LLMLVFLDVECVVDLLKFGSDWIWASVLNECVSFVWFERLNIDVFTEHD
jgi:hypothetical protein